MLLKIEEAFVGVDHLLQARVRVCDEGERMVVVILLVYAADFAQLYLAVDICRSEDAAREVAPHGYEADVALEAVLQLVQALPYLLKMLVGERLVDGYVVVAPAEVRRGRRLHARTCGAGDGVYMQLRVEHKMFCQRQDGKLYAGGKASGIGNVARVADAPAVKLGQSVHEIVLAIFDAVVHAEVYYLQGLRNGMALHELACVAVGGAEEQEVDALQRQLVGETQVGLAKQVTVYVGNHVAGIARAADKHNLGIGVIEQKAYQFACRISCTTYNSNLNHIFSSLWLL